MTDQGFLICSAGAGFPDPGFVADFFLDSLRGGGSSGQGASVAADLPDGGDLAGSARAIEAVASTMHSRRGIGFIASV
jgi:hypothetical protein